MIRRFAATFLSVLILAATPLLAQAEEEASEPEYSYGTVRSLTDNILTITEYDYEKDEDVSVNYDVSAAKLENAGTLAEIQPGDTVDLLYTMKGTERSVMSISVEKADQPDIGAEAPKEGGAPEPSKDAEPTQQPMVPSPS